MRLWVAALLVLAACGKKSTPDPAWPESAGSVTPETWEEDGGESLDPVRETRVEHSETDVPEEDATAAVDAGAAPSGDDRDEMIIDDGDDAP